MDIRLFTYSREYQRLVFAFGLWTGLLCHERKNPVMMDWGSYVIKLIGYNTQLVRLPPVKGFFEAAALIIIN